MFKNGNPKAPELINRIYKQANEIIFTSGVLNKSGLMRNFGVEVGSSWVPPECGWVKINSDGACSNGGYEVAARGVIRDRSGS